MGATTWSLLTMQATADADWRAALNRISPRFEQSGKTIHEVATEAELAEIKWATRRRLAVERAQAAGGEYERRIGVPWPVPELQMTVTEDPSGELVLSQDADG